jgi:hypothetical protein
MNKTIVNIERINDCRSWLKPAKMPFFTPQASALAGLRYAPNHWSAHHRPFAPGFNAEDDPNFIRQNPPSFQFANPLAALPALG